MGMSAHLDGREVFVTGVEGGRAYVLPRRLGVYVDARDGDDEAAFVRWCEAGSDDPWLLVDARLLPRLRFDPVAPDARMEQDRVRRWDALTPEESP